MSAEEVPFSIKTMQVNEAPERRNYRNLVLQGSVPLKNEITPRRAPNLSSFQVGHLIWTNKLGRETSNLHLGKSLWHPKNFKKEIPLLGD